MKITIKREQRQARLYLPSVSNLRDAGAKTLKLLTAAAGALMIWGCDLKDPIYDTAHPQHGKITLTTDWKNIGSGVTAPVNYTVSVGDYNATVSGVTNTIDNLFIPGTYRGYIYNTAENITVSGSAVNVAPATMPGRQTDNYVNNMPGWFFCHAMDAVIEKDKHHQFTAVMEQQIRELTLSIKPEGGTVDRIAGISASLSGVAGSLSMDDGTHTSPSSVALDFVKGADGTYTAAVRLLGIAGQEQKLAGTITFTDGSPSDLPLDADLSTQLTGFNTEKNKPFALGSTVVETQTGTGFTATITDWEKVTGTGIAN